MYCNAHQHQVMIESMGRMGHSRQVTELFVRIHDFLGTFSFSQHPLARPSTHPSLPPSIYSSIHRQSCIHLDPYARASLHALDRKSVV